MNILKTILAKLTVSAMIILVVILFPIEAYSQLIEFPVKDDELINVARDNRISFLYSSHIYILDSKEKYYYESQGHLPDLKHRRASQIYPDTEHSKLPYVYYFKTKEDEKLVKYQDLGENYIRSEYKGDALVSVAEIAIDQIGWDLTSFKHSSDTINFLWKMLYNEYDVVDGTYTDYYPLSNLSKIIKSQGNCIDGTKVGEWKYHDDTKGIIIIVHYNSKGDVDGKYYEYYYDRRKIALREFPKIIDSSYTLITEGQYAIVDGQIRQDGTWNFYDKEGRILGETNFNWIKE
mgnify:CR=1 FL=1